MKLTETPLKDCFILEPVVHGDHRGFFMESFNQKVFNEVTDTNYTFVQDNHSSSRRGVLRGLHYQLGSPQGKLVRVLKGEVYDVAVDLRKSSASFGQSFGIYLNDQQKKMFWVPPGFAHGFVVLSEQAEFFYKTTDYYMPKDEKCIVWNDPMLNIDWKYEAQPMLSGKDISGDLFKNASYYK